MNLEKLAFGMIFTPCALAFPYVGLGVVVSPDEIPLWWALGALGGLTVIVLGFIVLFASDL
jgi:hypothetical protein